MALAVDAAGRVAANPKTGKIAGGSTKNNGGGAAALREALGSNELIPTVEKQKLPGEESVNEVLSRGKNRVTPVSTTRQSSPEVSTASIPSSLTFRSRESNENVVSPMYSSQPEGMAAHGGNDMSVATTPINAEEVGKAAARSVGLDPEHKSDQSQWEEQRAKEEGREVRTANYFGDEYEDHSGILGSADNQLDMIGNTQWNDAYIRDAIANGADEEEMRRIMQDRDWFKALSLPLSMSGEERDSRDQGGLLAGSSVLDDGTYDYDHMTADNMTGTQYLHYAEMGMGGRPVEEIDPTQVYSKRRELVNYGFVPFTPDELSYANMVVDNAADFPARAGAALGGLRTKIPGLNDPYMINIGDKTVNGSDFDRLGGAYIHQVERDNEFDPSVLEFPVPDINGNMTYHYGYLNDVGDFGDGTYELGFTDGSTVEVDQDFFDSISNADGTVSMNDFSPVKKDDARGAFPKIDDSNRYDIAYFDAPDLVMPDGTRLTYEEAQNIYYDQEVGDNPDSKYDDNITYDLSGIPGLIDNRPSRLNAELFGENGKIDISTLGNNVVDWTLGSLPISVTRLANPFSKGEAFLDMAASPWLYSASNASSSMSGIDPGTYDFANDSYGLAFGNYDENGNLRYGVTTPQGNIDKSLADEAQFWNTLGNAAVPLTEEIVGPVGEYGVPVRKMLRWDLPNNPTTSEVVKDFLAGMVEEGVEEDLGNIFDELTSYGPRGAFARQALDENGNPMYDLTGHEIRDDNTPMRERMANFANPADLANSFAGGALVDAAMQLPSLRRNINNANNAKRIRQDLGLDRFVEPDEQERRKVSSSYLNQFDNGI